MILNFSFYNLFEIIKIEIPSQIYLITDSISIERQHPSRGWTWTRHRIGSRSSRGVRQPLQFQRSSWKYCQHISTTRQSVSYLLQATSWIERILQWGHPEPGDSGKSQSLRGHSHKVRVHRQQYRRWACRYGYPRARYRNFLMDIAYQTILGSHRSS